MNRPEQLGNTIDGVLEILKWIRANHGNLPVYIDVNDVNKFLPVLGIFVGEHEGRKQVAFYTGIDLPGAVLDLDMECEECEKQKRGTH